MPLNKKYPQKVIRVCQILEYYAPVFAGAAIRHHQITSLMKAQAVEKEVLTIQHDNQTNLVDEIDNVRIYRAKRGSSKNKVIREIVTSLNLCKIIWQRRKHYDVVHSISTNEFRVPVFLLAKLLGKPVVLEFVLMRSKEKSSMGNLLTTLAFFAYRFLDAYICVSTPLTQYLISKGFSKSKIKLIPNGVFPDKFKPISDGERARLRSELGIEQGVFNLVFVGSFIKRKGIDVLIDLMDRIRRLDNRIHLTIVGKDEFPIQSEEYLFADQMKQRILDAKLDNIIHITGEVKYDDVLHWLQASDVFVFPSRREGQGRVIVEAMSTGLPCICSELDGITYDMIEPGISGFIVKNHDVDVFTDQVSRLIECPELRRSVGAKAREIVVQRFNEQSFAREYRSLFESLVFNTN